MFFPILIVQAEFYMINRLIFGKNKMKVTVCELRNDPASFTEDWERLEAHVKVERSDLVLLPEMPFSPWFVWSPLYDSKIWARAIKSHQEATPFLERLSPAIVCGSQPVNRKGNRHNEAFIWDQKSGFHSAHTKYYLPNEKGYWEASWYERGDGNFTPVQAGSSLLGFVICTDIWFFQHARSYGKKGVHLIVCPRATPRRTLNKWLAGGQATAIVSGTFSLSSNKINQEGAEADLGGQGWIVDPEGKVLGLTSQEHPFLTLDLDLTKAEKAKETYPRYVKD
jgi:N-carbamoylputrescine amidase